MRELDARPLPLPSQGRIRLRMCADRFSNDGIGTTMSVTPAIFRRLALGLPEAHEAAHMGHPDFRVRNKIFASLGVPDRDWGTVKLTPEEQGVLLEAEPGAFKPAAGAWGRRGWTQVRLAAVDAKTLRSALAMAWRNTAPRTLATPGEARGTG